MFELAMELLGIETKKDTLFGRTTLRPWTRMEDRNERDFITTRYEMP
jgi:hypothetical protein